MSPELRRRTLLRRSVAAAGLVGVAGCTGGSTSGPGAADGKASDGSTATDRETGATDSETGETDRETTPSVATPTTTVRDPPPDATRRVRVESVAGRSGGERLALDVGVEKPYATPAHPPWIRATARNVGDRPVELRGHVSALIWPRRSQEQSPGLVLDPDPGRGATGDGGCWRQRGTMTVLSTSTRTEIRPGESATTDLAVLGRRENEACLPTGSYRFVDDFTSVCVDGDCRDWTVEFSLSVADPDR